MSSTMMTVFVRLLHPYLVALLITLSLGNKILCTKKDQSEKDTQM